MQKFHIIESLGRKIFGIPGFISLHQNIILVKTTSFCLEVNKFKVESKERALYEYHKTQEENLFLKFLRTGLSCKCHCKTIPIKVH